MITQKQHIVLCLTGREAQKELLGFLVGAKSVFVVHGHHSYHSSGAKSLIDESLKETESVLTEFADFSENPKMGDVTIGLKAFSACMPDAIIAVGGGSVIDMAKLIRFYGKSKVPLLAIPTTAGTGAESTHFAVCYIDGVKNSISHESILPNQVILYPELTYNNGRYLTSCTGFDALAQAIEAYWNINATHVSDQLAIRAIENLFPILPRDVLSPEDRITLLKSSNDAGRAINITRTTMPHALSYTLTSKYRYPHGHAVALTFPFFLKYNIEGGPMRYKGSDYQGYEAKMHKLTSLLNIDGDPFLVMKRYTQQLGLGFDPERDFDDQQVIKGLNLERAKNTPIAIDEQIVMEAVKSIRQQ